MRDIFNDIFAPKPNDPVEAVRRAARAPLKRRFFEKVSIADGGPGAFLVMLDDHGIRTPAGVSFILPTRLLAEAVAAEWRAQVDVINPPSMPLTRLSNSIIDGVAKACVPVVAEVVKYVGSDLLFYRAEGPEGLVARQAECWDPILDWARTAHGAHFRLVQGVTFVRQDDVAIAAMRAAAPADPWRLGAVHAITTLTGSALIALAVAAGELTTETAWAAAHVDEDWNWDRWGRDEPALQRRALRETEMRAAATVLADQSLLPKAGHKLWNSSSS
jgi:chaperone required for assembly of F1-ATPase